MIIRPFNAGFFLLMAVMIGAIVLLWALLRGRSEQRRVRTPIGIRNMLILQSCSGSSLNQLNLSSPDT